MSVRELRPPSAPAPWEELSPAERLALASPEERAAFFASLTDEAAAALKWEWEFWARPDQLLPDDFGTALVTGGRGTGKTKVGSEWARRRARTDPGSMGLFIGATPRDVRDLMIEGRSGIQTVSPPWERPTYEPSKLLLTWPNGTVAHVRSAAEPEGIRGPSVDWGWLDEPAKWKFLQKAWDNYRFAVREGTNPQTVLTTTPRPLKLLKDLRSGNLVPRTYVAPRVSTFRNAAHLAPDFLQEMLTLYEGTSLGLQELHGEFIADVEGALWKWALLEAARYDQSALAVEISPSGVSRMIPLAAIPRKVVGVDPSGSSTGDECGVIVAGANHASPPVGFVLDDRSVRGSPATWGEAAVDSYFDWECEAMVAEVNFGAEMVEHVIRTIPANHWRPGGEAVRFLPVRAGRGQDKASRMRPVVGLYEQNTRGFRRVYHVGNFAELEEQQTSWVPPSQEDSSGWSPDRPDALTWALSHLLVLHPDVEMGMDISAAQATLPSVMGPGPWR